jgi:KaiC/GvpD/RAD55 family RecA-like ATPase
MTVSSLGEARHEHAVQVYLDDRELAARVAAFLAGGLEAGTPIVVVATPEHSQLFSDALADLGWHAERIAAECGLVFADARQTLESILVDGVPSALAFDAAVGALLDRANERRPVAPLVYGEMVDLLSAEGETDTAIALEAMWNELARRRPFTLLCAYRLDLFDREAQTHTAPAICRVHSRVGLSYDEERLSVAVGLAMAEVLGTRKADDVYYIVGSRTGGTRIPLVERALMWIGGYSPSLADRVLERARARYAGETEFVVTA